VATPKITSREYKIMLRTAQLQGEDGEITQSVMAFWRSFQQAIENIAPDTDGRLTVEERRLIRFHDTSNSRLNRNGYIFRERIDEASGQREVTLKFRHPDRYFAASRDMAAAARNTRTKFEEDIKAPYHGLYSHSTTQQIGARKNLNKLNDPCRLFPSLPKQLDRYDDGEAIAVVSDLTVRELVLAGANFRLRNSPRVEAECAIIVWYDMAGHHHRPEVGEFSFRYGDDHEAYGGKAAQRAYEVFKILEGPALADWVDPTGMTKTAYAYSRASR
jgi:hypothetical protein